MDLDGAGVVAGMVVGVQIDAVEVLAALLPGPHKRLDNPALELLFVFAKHPKQNKWPKYCIRSSLKIPKLNPNRLRTEQSMTTSVRPIGLLIVVMGSSLPLAPISLLPHPIQYLLVFRT
jgi:hypothetical protein